MEMMKNLKLAIMANKKVLVVGVIIGLAIAQIAPM
jgi:hypothetical protein